MHLQSLTCAYMPYSAGIVFRMQSIYTKNTVGNGIIRYFTFLTLKYKWYNTSLTSIVPPEGPQPDRKSVV